MTLPEQPTRPLAARLRGQISWRYAFTALKYRNYRLWFWSQMISLFGTWMQSTTQGFLVYDLTSSATYLGTVAFAAGAPSWVLTLYGGVIADRLPRRTLLLVTQATMMVLAFLLAALSFAGIVQPWHIVVLAFVLGMVNAFEAPVRLAFVLEMVEREDLANAVALNSTMFNTAMAVGPAVAGLTYAVVGPAWCFTINGISFIAVIVALLMMKIAPQPQPARRASPWADLKEGFRYVAGQPMIRALIGLIAAGAMFGVSFATLLPAWAVQVLGGDAATNGWLQAARGLGALISALLIASLGRFRFKGKLLTIGTLASPLAMLAFALVRWLPLALLTLVAVGGTMVLVMNLANTLVQTLSSDQFRGRVMGVYSLAFFGLMPIGGLLIGAAADAIGEPLTMGLTALLSLGSAALVYFLAPRLRELQ